MSGLPAPAAALPQRAYHLLRAALARFGKTPAELSDEELQAVRRQAQREYELEGRVLRSAQARDVHLPPGAVERAYATVAERYPEPRAFEEDLARNGLDPDGLRRALERELRVEAVLERVAARAAEVGELEARIYYYLHPERFTVPETRLARHILITLNEAYAENRREAALARIERIAERLRRDPRRFAEQAGKHSECPTAMQGGRLGRVPRGTLYPELEAVLFSLREGEVSRVVESPLGFHLLYCERIHPARRVSCEEAMPQILQRLRERQRRICQRAWLRRLGADTGRNDADE